jgi:hypothetical protein
MLAAVGTHVRHIQTRDASHVAHVRVSSMNEVTKSRLQRMIQFFFRNTCTNVLKSPCLCRSRRLR